MTYVCACMCAYMLQQNIHYKVTHIRHTYNDKITRNITVLSHMSSFVATNHQLMARLVKSDYLPYKPQVSSRFREF